MSADRGTAEHSNLIPTESPSGVVLLEALPTAS
jgi:hypothetical protein